MWFLIKNIIISILIIYFTHSLWNYILQTCTIKKKKDLVKFQEEKYASFLNNASSVPKVSDEFEMIGITANEMNEYILDAISAIDNNNNNNNNKDDIDIAGTIEPTANLQINN